MKNIVLVTPPHHKDKYQRIINSVSEADIGNKIHITQVEDKLDEIENAVDKANALIGCPRHFFTNNLLTKTGELEWVHCPGAGVRPYLFQEFINQPITFTNGKQIQGPECADHAIALLLLLSRNFLAYFRGENIVNPRPLELYGKVVTIFGAGGIGLLIAQRAKAFGMKVQVVDIDYKPMLCEIDEFYNFEDLDKALVKSDAVIISAPLTDVTHKLFSRDTLLAIKKGAFLINISRGGIIDTDDLIACLELGHFRGIGLDVTDPEPLSDDSQLRRYNNVVITPHIAGLSDANHARSIDLIIKNIYRYANKMPLVNVVNKEYGY